MKTQKLFRLGLVLVPMTAMMASSAVMGIAALSQVDETADDTTGSYPSNKGWP